MKRNIVNFRKLGILVVDSFYRYTNPNRDQVGLWFNTYFKNWQLRHGPLTTVFDGKTFAPDDKGRHLDSILSISDSWLQEAVSKGEELHAIEVPQSLQDEIQHWLDYFQTLPNEPFTFSVQQLRKKIKMWEASFARKQRADLLEGTKVVVLPELFSTRFYVVELQTQKAYQNEGSIMHHCVATYWSRRGTDKIFSIRSLDSHRPLATVELITLSKTPIGKGFVAASYKIKKVFGSIFESYRPWVSVRNLRRYPNVFDTHYEVNKYVRILKHAPLPIEVQAQVLDKDPRFAVEEQINFDFYANFYRVGQAKASFNRTLGEDAFMVLEIVRKQLYSISPSSCGVKRGPFYIDFERNFSLNDLYLNFNVVGGGGGGGGATTQSATRAGSGGGSGIASTGSGGFNLTGSPIHNDPILQVPRNLGKTAMARSSIEKGLITHAQLASELAQYTPMITEQQESRLFRVQYRSVEVSQAMRHALENIIEDELSKSIADQRLVRVDLERSVVNKGDGNE